MRTLYVKETTAAELKANGWPVFLLPPNGLFIRCTKKGTVNWNAAPVYRAAELVGRDNVRVIR